jgi:hypothetical protein
VWSPSDRLYDSHVTWTFGTLATLAAVVATGCSGTRTVTVTAPATTTRSALKVPPAPVARGVPDGYRAKQVWHTNLAGSEVPEVVVSSVGPPVGSLGFHSADLRVLEWDALPHRWSVAFDAQKVKPPNTYGEPGRSNSGPGYYPDALAAQEQKPLLDPNADVRLGPVRFGTLLDGSRLQLVFSAAFSYGGSGVPTVLAVVDFKGDLANLAYVWSGEGLGNWKIANRSLRARANYWTPADSHCCPLRTYGFTVASRNGYLAETRDDRPWLGLTVRELNGPGGLAGPLQVTELAGGSPARGHLRAGDVLLDVLNGPSPPKQADPTASSSFFNKLNRLDAGDVAKLSVQRGGSRIEVSVPLGSMKDAYGQPLPTNDYTIEAL